MRLVDQQHCAVTAADAVQFGQRGQRTVCTEDRVGEHQSTFFGALGQGRRHRLRVPVGSHHHPRARQTAGIDQRGVRTRIGDDEGARAGQGDHRPEIGGVSRGEDQRRLRTHEGRELLLEFFVQLGVAGDKTRAGGSGTPYPQRLDTCLDDLRMPGKAQVVVGSQVDLGFGRAAGTQPST
ncbi:Uncharacterised protein [Mycobacteroides abscessus subsp. abscessus]|nr:Uncharacterised protein [Mycobacteroides abscessus subsp. abscessus]